MLKPAKVQQNICQSRNCANRSAYFPNITKILCATLLKDKKKKVLSKPSLTSLNNSDQLDFFGRANLRDKKDADVYNAEIILAGVPQL